MALPIFTVARRDTVKVDTNSFRTVPNGTFRATFLDVESMVACTSAVRPDPGLFARVKAKASSRFSAFISVPWVTLTPVAARLRLPPRSATAPAGRPTVTVPNAVGVIVARYAVPAVTVAREVTEPFVTVRSVLSNPKTASEKVTRTWKGTPSQVSVARAASVAFGEVMSASVGDVIPTRIGRRILPVAPVGSVRTRVIVAMPV